MEQFFVSENWPFSIALALMALIAAVELVGMLFGLAPSEAVDSMLPDVNVLDLEVPDVDIPDLSGGAPLTTDLDMPTIQEGGFFTKVLGWMSFGRVPALIWLVIFLGSFGLSGFAIQTFTSSFSGFYLPAWLASLPAIALTLPATSYLGRGLAKILPKDETEAVSRDQFVGRVATIIRGVATHETPAEAKLTDQHGLTHYVLVVPDLETEELSKDDSLLIVKKQGNVFHVIKNHSSALSK